MSQLNKRFWMQNIFRAFVEIVTMEVCIIFMHSILHSIFINILFYIKLNWKVKFYTVIQKIFSEIYEEKLVKITKQKTFDLIHSHRNFVNQQQIKKIKLFQSFQTYFYVQYYNNKRNDLEIIILAISLKYKVPANNLT